MGSGLKNFFLPFGPQLDLKIKGGGGGLPPLDPPLLVNVRRGVSLKNKRLRVRVFSTTHLPRC